MSWIPWLLPQAERHSANSVLSTVLIFHLALLIDRGCTEKATEYLIRWKLNWAIAAQGQVGLFSGG